MVPSTIEERLAVLEKANRRLRNLCGALLVAAAGAVTMGQEGPQPPAPPPARSPVPAPPPAPRERPAVLDAQTFVVRDAAGNPRASFGLLVPRDPNDPVARAAMDGGLPCLMLRDGTGAVRVSVIVGQEGVPSMQMFDKAGRPRTSIGVAADGTPSFTLHDGAGGEAVGISVKANGDALLEVRRGLRGLSLAATEGSDAAVLLRDDEGKVRASLYPDGLLLNDARSVRRAGFVTLEDGCPQIFLADEEGKPTHKIP